MFNCEIPTLLRRLELHEELNSTTSSRDLSASTDLSSDTMSESEDPDEDEQEQVHEEITDETCSKEEEEPLYKGSKISKVLSFVLIVSFVLKHNLSNSAWTDLLRLLTALLGEPCKKSFQSVYKMKSFRGAVAEQGEGRIFSRSV